jgi:hypothetical protein
VIQVEITDTLAAGFINHGYLDAGNFYGQHASLYLPSYTRPSPSPSVHSIIPKPDIAQVQ